MSAAAAAGSGAAVGAARPRRERQYQVGAAPPRRAGQYQYHNNGMAMGAAPPRRAGQYQYHNKSLCMYQCQQRPYPIYNARFVPSRQYVWYSNGH